MTPPSQPLLAIQAEGLEFALEPGRTYTLGANPHCDLRLAATAVEIVARITLGEGTAIVKPANGRSQILAPGDSLRLDGVELRVVVDAGNAVILPDPRLRTVHAEPPPPPAAAPLPDVAPPPPAAPPVAPIVAPRPTTFADLMAHELRRAPWLALSLLLHALLLLILLWLFPAVDRGDPERATHGFQGSPGEDLAAAPAMGLPEVVVEPSLPDVLTMPEPPQPDVQAVATPDVAAPTPSTSSLLRIGGERVAKGGGGDALLAGGGSEAGAFRATVHELRRSGLEVVFVIDSTGSMGSSIAAAKAGIGAMLEVLQGLVPDARFGLVTYRDRGPGEDYLLRVLRPDRDFYAAVNFVQSIEADGGGDVPEAVLDGLRAAFQFDYRPGARRVVVLAGDAPPHKKELQPLLDEVRRFVADQHSVVHALITSRGHAPEVVGEPFRRIAEQGRGICADVDDQRRILEDVLALAFGAQFRGNLAAVEQSLADQRRSPPTWALQLARSGGPELERAFLGDAVPTAVVHALVRLPRRTTTCQLADLLGAASPSMAGRQAIAHVLQQQLGLEHVPVDPERPRAAPRHVVAQLRDLAEKLPK